MVKKLELVMGAAYRLKLARASAFHALQGNAPSSIPTILASLATSSASSAAQSTAFSNKQSLHGAYLSALNPTSFQQLRGFSAPPSEPDAPIVDPLREALVSIVSLCVDRVEQNDLDGAIKLLRAGLAQFEPSYAGRPEIGELHNQLSLLLYFDGNADEAAPHAEVAYETTLKAFGEKSALTGHRLLRLGVVRFAQGRLQESANMLKDASVLIKEDNSCHEVDMYLDMEELSRAVDGIQVQALDESLAKTVSLMNKHFGTHSIVLSLAMSNHAAMVNRLVTSQPQNTMLYEALYKQHARLLEVLDPNSDELALCNFKLASFYYSQDLLASAVSHVQQSIRILLATYPEDHHLVLMCKHRMGMICAASKDHRSAVTLLNDSKAHFEEVAATEESQAKDSVAIVKEAELGLAMAGFWAISRGGGEKLSSARREALEKVEAALHALAGTVGMNNMLVVGASRYYAQIKGATK